MRSDSPADPDLPTEVRSHYRHFAWVVHEQRLLMLVLAFLAAACGMVWILAWRLARKAPAVVRAPASLKEAAAAFYGVPEVAYDQMAFFLHGCLPLLYAADENGHLLLPLAQGLVAPEIYTRAERRLDAARRAVAANRVTQALTLTGVSDVVADAPSRRAAAYVRGYLTVTLRREEAQFFPWRAQVLLEVNPAGRLNAWPFFLARLEDRVGPSAPAWDRTHDEARLLSGGVREP